MTPAEKARQLVDSYELTLRPIFSLNDYDTEKHYYKQCALIAVDGIIDELDAAGLYTSFWYEVKQEIEKL